MLRITADIFSGRVNPNWVLSDDEAQAVLEQIASRDDASIPVDAGFQGLGNRGLVVETLQDHIAAEHALPTRFRLSGSSSGLEIADRLIALMSPERQAHPATVQVESDAGHDEDLRRYILETLPGMPGGASTLSLPSSGASMTTQDTHHVLAAAAPVPPPKCQIETVRFDPKYWNDPAHINVNNCYAFASNRRTDTFAQPGRASGHQYTHNTCADVTSAAVRDGAVQTCAPASENPRFFMALVIAPGPTVVDYHWYRKCTEGFWAHKPGKTAARNVDNSNHVITDPSIADRGPYTQFCGYLFAQKRMNIR